MAEHRKVAVVDFDGTIARYDGWKGSDHAGEPVSMAKESLEEIRSWGWLIVVYTTRGDVDFVRGWLVKNEMPFDEINSCSHNPDGCSNKPIATVYFDDREAHSAGCKWYDWHTVMKKVRRVYAPRKEFKDQWCNS